jgi:hypothetical protein
MTTSPRMTAVIAIAAVIVCAWQRSEQQRTAPLGRRSLIAIPGNAESRGPTASIPVAGVVFEQQPRTDTQRRNDQRHHQKRG